MSEEGICSSYGVFFPFFFSFCGALVISQELLLNIPTDFQRFFQAQITLINYLSVWQNHKKFKQFLSNQEKTGGKGGEGKEGEERGAYTWASDILEERLEDWLRDLPLFIYRYYYLKRSFLREVCWGWSC